LGGYKARPVIGCIGRVFLFSASSALFLLSPPFGTVSVRELTFEARKAVFSKTTGLRKRPVPEEMKNVTKNGKPRSNGARFTRGELLAAHQRALKVAEKMTAREGFQSLVTAGIITPAGKLKPRYGG